MFLRPRNSRSASVKTSWRKSVFLRMEILEDRRLLATFNVSNISDCSTAACGSFRRALLDANANGPGMDLINFTIGGSVQNIQPLTALPLVTSTVTIDGFSANGSGPGLPLIQLNGFLAGSSSDGLVFISPNNIVRGLIVNDFGGNGLVFFTGSNNLVEGCFIGTDAAGTAAVGNGLSGILIQSGSNGNTIGGTLAASRNVISGNTTNGIALTTNNNTIKNNYIGTEESGQEVLAGGGNGVGIALTNASGNIIGGPGSSDRNVISGNLADGVTITGGANNTIQGNYIGTDLTGTMRLPDGLGNPVGNGGSGLALAGGTNNNTIGGTVLSGTTNVTGNLLSGNGGNGLSITGNTNTVQGNRIGTDVDGLLPLPNSNHGISITTGSNNTIGGTIVGARNLISGNAGDGVSLSGNNNQIRGNYIGVTRAGNGVLGNLGNGVTITGSAINNAIGGTILSGTINVTRNLISANGVDGVALKGGGVNSNSVQGNLIGTDRTGATITDIGGTLTLGNAGNGITISDGANNNTIGGTALAGTLHAARNIIAGSGKIGVHILNSAATQNNKVQGNFIGTDSAGAVALANNRGVAISGAAANNTIGGTIVAARNLISGNTNYGVGIFDRFTTGNKVQGNYIGTEVSGTLALGNGEGVNVFSAASDNFIGGTVPLNQTTDFTNVSRNLISGNVRQGVRIYDTDTSGNKVQGNYIGTDFSGTVALANGFGVEIEGGATSNLIGGTIAAGATIGTEKQAASLNLISGNIGYGVGLLDSRTALNVVEGNWIGLEVSGTIALANATGVSIFNAANKNIIGGTVLDAQDENLSRNIISGNTGNGVAISGPGTSENVVLGNYIGLLPDGLTAMANGLNGVRIFLQASKNLIGGIGGTEGDAGNYISGNGPVTCTNNCTDGVRMDSGAFENVIQGNYIGINRNDNQVPNKRHGIAVVARRQDDPKAERNVIGGTQPGEGNEIAFHPRNGVLIEHGRRNQVRGNSIHNHPTGLGIELLNGGNMGQLFPTINSAVFTPPTTLQIFFTMNGAPNTQYSLDFFANLLCHPSNFGEGEFYLGFFDVTTDGAGTFSGMVIFSTFDLNTMNPILTGTATDPIGNSSQFSQCHTFTPNPPVGNRPGAPLDDEVQQPLPVTAVRHESELIASNGSPLSLRPEVIRAPEPLETPKPAVARSVARTMTFSAATGSFLPAAIDEVLKADGLQ